MTWRELGILSYRRTGRFLACDATVAYRLSAPAFGPTIQSLTTLFDRLKW